MAATIVVKNSTIGVASDNNGKFTLNVPETPTLVISAIGYKAKPLA